MKKTFLVLLFGMLLPAVAPAQHWSLTWKRLQSVSPGLEMIGRIEPRTSRELDNPRWSVGCECLDRDYADFSAYKSYVGELGVGAARIQSGWARCEQKKGRYDFEWLDEVVDGLCEQGIRPWMCLAYGNPVYGAQKSLGSRIFTDEATLQAWERYVTAVVERYRDRVHEWEVWNEPNLRGTNQADAYGELLIRTAEAEQKRRDMWERVKAYDKALYYRLRCSTVSGLTYLPGRLGGRLTVGGYRFAKRIYQFQ